ncbi:hypothetical protein CR970_00635 [Candidatus Saccharibacteria bacterium]|nr:MAG: hypothetical protein CR970_00635 [Candidatus Saccharibacteria bacterium]
MSEDDFKAALQSAEVERERLTSLINSMADGVIAIDTNAKVVLYNGAALNILDLNEIQPGIRLTDVMQLVDSNLQAVDLREVISNTKTATVSRDWRIRYGDGSLANLYVSITPVQLGYGRDGMQGYVMLLRDITREKSLEEERNEFISVVSHELRTPIAIAEGNIGNAEFILNKTGDLEQAKQALDLAHKQTVFLAELINDLSTLSRAEQETLSVELTDINMYELINELVTTHRPEAARKDLMLVAEQNTHLELLHSSRLYVREILQNFITNAIKYTDSGTIAISAQQHKSAISVTVTDTGNGISKTDQEKLFDKFFRSEDYHTRKNSGTGLGLYVAMKLARLLHAEIEVQSKLGSGSAFTVTIPNLGDASGPYRAEQE